MCCLDYQGTNEILVAETNPNNFLKYSWECCVFLLPKTNGFERMEILRIPGFHETKKLVTDEVIVYNWLKKL